MFIGVLPNLISNNQNNEICSKKCQIFYIVLSFFCFISARYTCLFGGAESSHGQWLSSTLVRCPIPALSKQSASPAKLAFSLVPAGSNTFIPYCQQQWIGTVRKCTNFCPSKFQKMPKLLKKCNLAFLFLYINAKIDFSFPIFPSSAVRPFHILHALRIGTMPRPLSWSVVFVSTLTHWPTMRTSKFDADEWHWQR